MATTLLTFLGATQYKPVTYVWRDADGEKTHTTHLFPEAAALFFEPARVVVCVTPTAKEYRPPGETKTYLEMLQDRLRDLRRVEPLKIPEGRSETELWEIFDRIANAVEEKEEIILDITHAFRSLPLVVFGAAAYLRRTRGVSIHRIIYGAYEARVPISTQPHSEDRAPVFDLTPLLDLMDWLSGAGDLLERGDAQTLADLMEQAHRRLRRERPVEGLPQQLQNIAHKLRALSRALHLARPIDVMKTASELWSMLDSAKSEFQQWAKPFAVIVEKVQEEIASLSYESPERLDAENLRRQLALVEYYLKKGLTVQAITLAREWVVSRTVFQRGEGDWLGSTERSEAEKALNYAFRRWYRQEQADVPGWLERWPQARAAVQTWDWLGQLRNDVAHCGMRSGAASADSIARRAQGILGRLQALLDEAPEGPPLWTGRVVIDLKALYGEVAKLDELPVYLERAREQAGEGQEIVLTGQAPIWLYLTVAHALHGKARRLWYSSPVTGEVLVFDHSPR